MFVRTKQVGAREYHYLVECSRDGARVRQRVIAYLGQASTLSEAIADYRREIEVCEAKVRTAETEDPNSDTKVARLLGLIAYLRGEGALFFWARWKAETLEGELDRRRRHLSRQLALRLARLRKRVEWLKGKLGALEALPAAAPPAAPAAGSAGSA